MTQEGREFAFSGGKYSNQRLSVDIYMGYVDHSVGGWHDVLVYSIYRWPLRLVSPSALRGSTKKSPALASQDSLGKGSK